MSHHARQGITVTATNHYRHFIHLPYATHHKTHERSLPLNPFLRAKQTDVQSQMGFETWGEKNVKINK